MTDIIQPVAPVEAPTPEQIAQHYSAAMDSVNLLKAGKPKDQTDEEWADTVKRNVEHLKIQLDKPAFYEGYDLTPFWDAVGQK